MKLLNQQKSLYQPSQILQAMCGSFVGIAATLHSEAVITNLLPQNNKDFHIVHSGFLDSFYTY